MRGFTTVELLIAIAIVVIASAVALPFYGAYADRAERSQAAADLMRIDMTIERFSMQNFNFPDALADIGLNGLLDPWGRPLRYVTALHNQTSVRMNAGHPYWVCAGPNGRFGDDDPGERADNISTDEPL